MSALMLLIEGFTAAILPCTLILLVPGVAVSLTARETALPALTGFGLSVLAFSWLRFSGTGAGWPALVSALALLISVAILLVPPIQRLDLVALLGGALAGFAAAELWLPCVGAEFGSLLTRLPDAGTGGLVSLGVYLLGALSPLLALGAIHHLTANWFLEIIEPPLSVVGGLLLAGLAVAVVVGFHETVVGKLFEWSLAYV